MKLSVILIDGMPPAGFSTNSEVEVYAVPRWGMGFEQARGERVAVLSLCYSIGPTWLETAMNTKSAMTWGMVEPDSDVSPYYLLEYSHLLNNGIRNPLVAPGGNVVYHRDVVSRIKPGDFLREVDFHKELLGKTTQFDPLLNVTLAAPPPWPQYRTERWAASFQWAQTHHQGAADLLTRLALPPLIVSRIATRVHADGRYKAAFWRGLPRIIEGSMIQMSGEISGILAGNRDERMPPR